MTNTASSISATETSVAVSSTVSTTIHPVPLATATLSSETKKVPSQETLTKLLKAITTSKELLEKELDAKTIQDEVILEHLKVFPAVMKRSVSLIQHDISNCELFLNEIATECERMKDIIHARIGLIEAEGSDIRDKVHALTLLGAIANSYISLQDALVPTILPKLQSHAQWENERLRLEQQLTFTHAEVKSHLDTALKQIQTYAAEHYTTPKNCYISYATVDEQKQEEKWVKPFLEHLRTDLRSAGILAELDDKNNSGGSMYTYMDGLKAAGYVIIIGTQSLLEKHKGGIDKVCNELILINGRRGKNSKTVIPVLLSGNFSEAFPPYFITYTTIRDWRESSYQTNLKMLIQQLYQVGADDTNYQKLWQEFEVKHGFLTRPFPQETVTKQLAEEAKLQQSEQKMDTKLAEQFFQEAKSGSNAPSTKSIITKLWYLPEHTPYFTGRAEQLKEIHQKLTTQNMAVIVGTGGIGKTQTILYYAREYAKFYPGGVWWFNVEDPGQLYLGAKGYQEFAQALGISIDRLDQETVIKKVKTKLMQQPPMLLIYDNVVDQDSIKAFLLSSDSANYHDIQHRELITSRNCGPQDWKQTAIVQLPLFNEIDAVKFILDTLSKLGNAGESATEAKLLAKELGYLPLALKMAVRTIRRGSIAEYLEKYQKSISQRMELLQKCYPNDQDGDNYRQTVFSTWDLSRAQIREKFTSSKDKFIKIDLLLQWMAYLDSFDIPVKLFVKTFGEDDLQEFLEVLCDHSLLEFIPSSRTYNMYKLLQEVIRIKNNEWLLFEKAEQESTKEKEFVKVTISKTSDSKESKEVYQTCLVKPKRSLPQQRLLELKDKLSEYYVFDKKTAKEFTAAKQLIPHCLKLIEHFKSFALANKEQEDMLLAEAYILAITADALHSVGEVKKQKPLLERALKIQEKYYGEKHPEVAKTLGNLGSALGDLGDVKGKKELLERALKIFETCYGKDHIEVAKTLINLGSTLGYLGDATGEKEMLEHALEIQTKYYKDNHPEVAKALMNLGTVFGALGDFKKQKILFERSLKILEAHYGNDNPTVATALANLGSALGILGDTKGAKALFERALKIEEAHYGTNHPVVAKTLVNLAITLGDIGNVKEQKAYLERALKIDEDYYGSDHHEVAKTLESVAAVANTPGQDRKTLLERALKIEEAHYGANHPEVAKTLVNFGAVLTELGEINAAKELFERALKIQEMYYGKDHIVTAITLADLGIALGASGDVRKEKDLLQRALKIEEAYYGEDHPEVANTLSGLAEALGTLGNINGKNAFLERALLIFESHYGEHSIKVAKTKYHLAIAYLDLKKIEKAISYTQDALKIYTEIYGPENNDVKNITKLFNVCQKIKKESQSQVTKLEIADNSSSKIAILTQSSSSSLSAACNSMQAFQSVAVSQPTASQSSQNFFQSQSTLDGCFSSASTFSNASPNSSSANSSSAFLKDLNTSCVLNISNKHSPA